MNNYSEKKLKQIEDEQKKEKKLEGDDDEEEEENYNNENFGKLEDVRMSNFAYSQTKIAEYLSFYFAAIGVGSAIISAEILYGKNRGDMNEQWIKIMLIVTNISTIPLSKQSFILHSLQLLLSL